MINRTPAVAFILLVMVLLSAPVLSDDRYQSVQIEAVNGLIDQRVRDGFNYAGLAQFYNSVDAYVVSDGGVKRLLDNAQNIESGDSLAIVGHYKVLLLQGLSGPLSFEDGRLRWADDLHGMKSVGARIISKSELNNLEGFFSDLRYIHLWYPIRILCRGVESILLWINSFHSMGWGLSIVLLSIVFKFLFLPVNIFLMRVQRSVSLVRVRMEPELDRIKHHYSGEEAHNRFMEAHKSQGVTPFYTLKPLLLTFVPVPFLIAIFNVLGEFDPISGHGFLWIHDLAYPDTLYNFDVDLFMLGSGVNVLPVLMTVLTVISALLYKDSVLEKKDLRRQRLNLYLMAFAFFILFYPFPAAMVLYWTCANIWQFFQQRFLSV